MSLLIDQGCILHSRPLRETSLILSCLTRSHGLMSFASRGGKRSQRGTNAKFQPFQTLSFEWKSSEKSGLLGLRNIDIIRPIWLTGTALQCGMYLNGLLIQLLNPEEPCTDLFIHFQKTIIQLEQPQNQLDIILREFEHALFSELGFSVTFEQITHPHLCYDYDLHHGFQVTHSRFGFLGSDLIALSQNDFTKPSMRKTAKRFSRHMVSLLKHLKYSEKIT
ncbi:MAG: DNA repair protein RecO [Gammaproteobacteria bacterium]|nr:DNA repair protein RecO [Gammaproteobacteria bacterium]